MAIYPVKRKRGLESWINSHLLTGGTGVLVAIVSVRRNPKQKTAAGK